MFEGLERSGAEVTPPFYFMFAWVSGQARRLARS